PTCNDDGFAEISNYDGNLTYTISPVGAAIDASGEISGDAGTYTVTVENGDGCQASAEVTIEEQLEAPDEPAFDITNPTCDDDGFAEISNYDANLTYTISPVGAAIDASGEISGDAGTYTVTVESGNGCQASAEVTIEEQLDVPTIS